MQKLKRHIIGSCLCIDSATVYTTEAVYQKKVLNTSQQADKSISSKKCILLEVRHFVAHELLAAWTSHSIAIATWR